MHLSGLAGQHAGERNSSCIVPHRSVQKVMGWRDSSAGKVSNEGLQEGATQKVEGSNHQKYP